MATARPLADLVDLATMPPADLLARTSSALLMIDLQNRFLFHPDGTEASTMRVLKPRKPCSLRRVPSTSPAITSLSPLRRASATKPRICVGCTR